MTFAIPCAPAAPQPWLVAGRVLLTASCGLLIHGLTGRGRPVRLCRRSGKLVRV